MAKKVIKKTAAKPVMAKPAPKTETKTCKCSGKKIVVSIVVLAAAVAVGFAAGKTCNKHHMKRAMMDRMNEMFVNGCLDATKVTCPKLAEKIAMMDADQNGCVTVEEFKSFKQEHRGCRK